VGIKSPLHLASRHMEASASPFISPKIKPGLHKFDINLGATSKKLGARRKNKIIRARNLLLFINKRTMNHLHTNNNSQFLSPSKDMQHYC
jgi:hypothetical protein